MGRGRIAALILAALVIGVALTRTATASHTSSHKAFSGGADFRGLVVKTDSSTKNLAAGVQVDSRGFSIPAGESQLIVVDFSAVIADCSAGCYARARVARTSGSPLTVLEPNGAGGYSLFADSNSTVGTMTKALCVRNPTGSPLNVNVWVEALASPGGTFEIQDWAIKIARNAPCDPFVNI